MNIDLSRPWKEVFALVAAAKAEERRKTLDHLMQEELDRQDRDKRVAKEKREKKEEEQKAFEQMLATTERLAEFSSRLDDLDTASVKALMINGEALDRAQAQLGAMLDNADRLPDGRRIFKTEDGTRVFDEHGAEIPTNVFDPHAIDDRHSRWEPFKALQEKKQGLEAERHELLAYQDKLDQARARVDRGGVTNKELDALDADLKSTMPQSVHDNLANRGAEVTAPDGGVRGQTALVQPPDRLRNAAPVGPGPT